METIVILLPAYNEEVNIKSLIDNIKTQSADWHIVVANSESTDKTKSIAESNNAWVLNCPRGKAQTVKSAISQLSLDRIDYLVMLDSDGTYPPDFIPALLYYLRKGEADVVVGYRQKLEKESMSFLHLIGNLNLTFILNLCYNYNIGIINDACSGMWAFNKLALSTIKINSKGFCLEANLYSEVYKKHLRLQQVPIVYSRRKKSRSKIKYLDAFKIGLFMISERIK